MSGKRDVANVLILGSEEYPERIEQELPLPQTLDEYQVLWRQLEELKHQDFDAWVRAMRVWTGGDLYFLLVFVLSPGRDAWDAYRERPHFWHPVHLWYSRHVQFDSDRVVNVAARRFGKSTHITFALNIQHRLIDPNSCSCIFSHTRELAQKHLVRIGDELRKNRILQAVWADRLWLDPTTSPTTWSVGKGYSLKRTTTRAEQSFEAHAFTTNLPTGLGFSELFFDDIENEKSNTTEDVVTNVREKFISAQDLVENAKAPRRVAGTYYHPEGAMMWIQQELGWRSRVVPGEDLTRPALPEVSGPLGGTPTFFTKEWLYDLIAPKGGSQNPQSRKSYAMQIACDPLAGEYIRLSDSWIVWYDKPPADAAREWELSVIICVDGSSGKEDPTFIWVWGLRHDKRLVWLDAYERRVPPSVRKNEIYNMCLKWQHIVGQSRLLQLRIENYSSEHAEQQEEYHREMKLRVPIVPCRWNTRGAEANKMERAYNRWEPALVEGSVLFPTCGIYQVGDDGNMRNIVVSFIEDELKMMPMPKRDNGLDAGGLIWDPDANVGGLPWPTMKRRDEYDRRTAPPASQGSHMSVGIL